ncbi:transmembrane protein, putative (macronuclear) [Tetrahymena thermophila SB210]|uniref:Transmembrane protein, putative n=1 Tax=Tetrahymena thermophila (strain SB210) TaxID=312017 RepID=W7XEF3_TETTS|nr:transmembrane protein, putative [Tetrahymena thermophila SB210]EWS76067.1 transmembrane protein, putative [Tetrahymena thermophila SB210]|eukprot:XP_012651374.1 transmembrane protein, putative [Tetrahymena thermophila SB210]
MENHLNLCNNQKKLELYLRQQIQKFQKSRKSPMIHIYIQIYAYTRTQVQSLVLSINNSFNNLSDYYIKLIQKNLQITFDLSNINIYCHFLIRITLIILYFSYSLLNLYNYIQLPFFNKRQIIFSTSFVNTEPFCQKFSKKAQQNSQKLHQKLHFVKQFQSQNTYSAKQTTKFYNIHISQICDLYKSLLIFRNNQKMEQIIQ